jgi:hypothetical protein
LIGINADDIFRMAAMCAFRKHFRLIEVKLQGAMRKYASQEPLWGDGLGLSDEDADRH